MKKKLIKKYYKNKKLFPKLSKIYNFVHKKLYEGLNICECLGRDSQHQRIWCFDQYLYINVISYLVLCLWYTTIRKKVLLPFCLKGNLNFPTFVYH